MSDDVVTTPAERAITLAIAGDTFAALRLLDPLMRRDVSATQRSAYGLCIARERGQTRDGFEYCARGMHEEPERPLHYLCSARIHLHLGQKREAIALLRQGLTCPTAGDPATEQIQAILRQLGVRRRPPLPFLHRDHRLNKYLGKLLGRLGLR
ncbi:MAG: hypothetical protein AAB426_01975 [Myxococcota bacterium]